ncbi:alpha,alpha-trehalase, partial [Shewanella sp. SR41-2]|nr:alpha,alpha-trehalase [Shewanella sp. SR41-2]
MEQIYDSTNQARQSLMFFESDLFKTVQISHIFTDSKTFADAIPRIAMNDILNEFNKISSNLSKAELLQFIANYFELPEYQSIVINNPS